MLRNHLRSKPSTSVRSKMVNNTLFFHIDELVMAEVPAAWQDNKKVLDRNSYLLENEIATDVCFELCSTDGSTTLVRAHKLMLLGASPVFEAMFCGEMAEARRDCDNIKIPDIDAETFREMLRFSYTLLCVRLQNLYIALAFERTYISHRMVVSYRMVWLKMPEMKLIGHEIGPYAIIDERTVEQSPNFSDYVAPTN